MTTAEESARSFAENPYHDRIEGDVLIYTAQGREGDQQLSGRNKRLIEQYTLPIPSTDSSTSDGKTIAS
jgi:hypothetical protein